MYLQQHQCQSTKGTVGDWNVQTTYVKPTYDDPFVNKSGGGRRIGMQN